MSNKQLKKSFNDILPANDGALPEQLVTFAESLYQMSLLRIPSLTNNGEIARYHLCAYLAAEKYQDSLNLGSLAINLIPMQPRLVHKFLDDFRVNLMNRERSSTPSPYKSPTKRRLQNSLRYTTPQSSPQKAKSVNAYSPQKSSPLKKLQEAGKELMRQKGASAELFSLADIDSPFNRKKNEGGSESVASTPQKYVKRQVTIPDLICFANNFFIPASVTPKLLESFLSHKSKFVKKNEWLLACGMIHAAYIRINHFLLQKQVGARNQFQNQIFQYQKGGLIKSNMLTWCDIVDDAIKQEPWVLQLEQKYIYGPPPLQEMQMKQETDARLGTGWRVKEKFCIMPLPQVDYTSSAQSSYYDVWSKRALLMLE